jgi:hypothetical protein
MSFPDANNPYASPTAVVVTQPAVGPFKPIDHIEHMRMFHYVFENPNWLTNILLSGLCILIPIIGGLVVLGYQFEAVAVLLSTQGARYPDFTFSRFAEYLVRGLWPFLVQLVASLVLVPIMFVVISRGIGGGRKCRRIRHAGRRGRTGTVCFFGVGIAFDGAAAAAPAGWHNSRLRGGIQHRLGSRFPETNL